MNVVATNQNYAHLVMDETAVLGTLVDATGLSVSRQLRLMAHIAYVCYVWPAFKVVDLMPLLGQLPNPTSRRTLERAVAKLTECGVLQKIAPVTNTATSYRVTAPDTWHTPRQD